MQFFSLLNFFHVSLQQKKKKVLISMGGTYSVTINKKSHNLSRFRKIYLHYKNYNIYFSNSNILSIQKKCFGIVTLVTLKNFLNRIVI